MSQHSQAPAGAPAPRGWRGRSAHDTPVVRHRWQRDWTSNPVQRARFRHQWQRLRLLLLGVIFTGALGVFTYLLLHAPEQTPLIAVAATSYEMPLPINAWALEDVAGLARLSNKSLQLVDATKEWTDRQACRQSLAVQLARLINRGDSQRTAIIYLSMHGVVDDAGEPCLLPVGASPYDPATWLPLRDILEEINNHPELAPWRKLLVLDCTREPSLTSLGVLNNEFAEQVAGLVEQAKVPGLAVLCASDQGERAWTSEELGHSVFGHFFQQGLAGRADDTQMGGDGNRRVSLQELHRYVTRQVDGWAIQNREHRQQPRLLPAEANFNLAWSVTDRATPPPAPALSVSQEQVAALWKARDQLDGEALLRVDPVAWHRLQAQLVRLSQMVRAGDAYAEESKRSLEQLAKTLRRLTERATALKAAESDFAWRGALAGADWFDVDPRRVHSLALSARLNLPRSASETIAPLERFISDPHVGTAEAAFAAWKDSPAFDTVEAQTLRLSRRYALGGDSNLAAAKGLEVRIAAERAAAPRDVRLLPWIRAQINFADSLRRAAEDALYGQESDKALAGFAGAQQEYSRSQETAKQVSAALNTCDRACAELPFWSQWLLAQRGVAGLPASHEALLQDVLRPAIEDTHLLARQLADPPQDGPDGQQIAVLQQISTRLKAALEQLNVAFLADAQRWLNEEDEALWPACAAGIEASFALPMLPAAQRMSLMQRRDSLIAALDQRPIAPYKSADNGAHDGNGNGKHPLDVLLAPLQSHSAAASPANLREALRDVAKLPGEPSQAGRTLPEHAMRIAAAIGVAGLAHDPVTEQRQRDWRLLWMWQAQRTLDDFLGSANEQAPPFFASAANDYLELAQIALPNDGNEAKESLHEIADLLARRIAAAQNSLATDAQDSLVLFAGQPARAQVSLRPRATATDLPAGTIGLLVRDNAGERLPARWLDAGGESEFHGVATPLAQPTEVELVSDSIAGGQAFLQVVAHLRGNEFAAPLVVRAAAGPTVTVQPTAPPKAEITIAGNVRKRPTVIFVLDCSRSMEDPIAVEASDAKVTSRLEIAKSALQTMLNQLAREKDARVGVRFVGHRVGWTTKEPLRLARQNEYGRPIPADLAPHADVEAALPLGRFDALAAGEMSVLMKTIVPWGQSPLYLGVMESLADLADVEADSDANIIVITDGANYQFVPSTLDRIAATETQTVNDVLRAAENKAVRVHIVGFGVPQGEAAQAGSEFNQIADATGGSYQNINEAGRLITHLGSLLGPSSFRVTSLSSRGGGSESAELGRSIMPNVSPGAENVFAVEFRTAREEIMLRGGERVELRVSADGGRLLAEPYTANVPVYGKLNDANGNPTGFSAGVHRPLQLPEGVQLAVSLKQDSSQFVSRPAQIWIEAEPRTGDGRPAGPTHVWYDPVYVDGLTAPVIRWTAQPWPRAANQVAVRCWVRTDAVEATVTRSLAKGTLDREPQQDVALPSTRWLVETAPAPGGEFEVRVAAWQLPEAGSFPALKVDVQTGIGGLVPRRIERVFDSANRVSAHRFLFAVADVSPEELELQLTSREAIAADAWQLAEPVIVNIDAGVELLQPGTNLP